MKRKLKIDTDGDHYKVYACEYHTVHGLFGKRYTEYWYFVKSFNSYDDAYATVVNMLKFPQYFE